MNLFLFLSLAYGILHQWQRVKEIWTTRLLFSYYTHQEWMKWTGWFSVCAACFHRITPTSVQSKIYKIISLPLCLSFLLSFSLLHFFVALLLCTNFYHLGCGNVYVVGWACELRLIVVNLVIWFTNIKVIEFYLNFHISFSLIYGRDGVFCALYVVANDNNDYDEFALKRFVGIIFGENIPKNK